MIDLEMEIKELRRSTQQYSQHNIADPLSQVCHSRLAVGRSQQVKEYKHTHANIKVSNLAQSFIIST